MITATYQKSDLRDAFVETVISGFSAGSLVVVFEVVFDQRYVLSNKLNNCSRKNCNFSLQLVVWQHIQTPSQKQKTSYLKRLAMRMVSLRTWPLMRAEPLSMLQHLQVRQLLSILLLVFARSCTVQFVALMDWTMTTIAGPVVIMRLETYLIISLHYVWIVFLTSLQNVSCKGKCPCQVNQTTVSSTLTTPNPSTSPSGIC